jgi:hypothetical protein
MKIISPKNKNYEIIENFLDKVYYNKLKNFLYGPEIPWFFRKNDVENPKTGNSDNGFFNFCWYNNSRPNYHLFDEHLNLVLNKLKCHTPIQVRANLTFRDVNSVDSDWHIDDNVVCGITAILYFTSCNAKTLLNIDNKIISVDSCENRLIKFKSIIPHKLIYHTDIHKRIIINFNYLTKDCNL